jgi:hypothetical protein
MLQIVEACDNYIRNPLRAAETESAAYSAHLIGLAWINSQKKALFPGWASSELSSLLSPDRSRATIWVRLLPKALSGPRPIIAIDRLPPKPFWPKN